MEDYTDDKWITRQELANRYGVPVKTPAEWASKGTGPRYAKFGRHGSVPAERCNRLGTKTIRRGQAQHRVTIMVR
jgi:hypothetical protein